MFLCNVKNFFNLLKTMIIVCNNGGSTRFFKPGRRVPNFLKFLSCGNACTCVYVCVCVCVFVCVCVCVYVFVCLPPRPYKQWRDLNFILLANPSSHISHL